VGRGLCLFCRLFFSLPVSCCFLLVLTFFWRATLELLASSLYISFRGLARLIRFLCPSPRSFFPPCSPLSCSRLLPHSFSASFALPPERVPFSTRVVPAFFSPRIYSCYVFDLAHGISSFCLLSVPPSSVPSAPPSLALVLLDSRCGFGRGFSFSICALSCLLPHFPPRFPPLRGAPPPPCPIAASPATPSTCRRSPPPSLDTLPPTSSWPPLPFPRPFGIDRGLLYAPVTPPVGPAPLVPGLSLPSGRVLLRVRLLACAGTRPRPIPLLLRASLPLWPFPLLPAHVPAPRPHYYFPLISSSRSRGLYSGP